MHLSSTLPFLSTQVTASNRFCLQLPSKPQRKLTVICGGWEQCARDYVIDRATFPYGSIELVVKGTGTLVLAGRAYPLQPGTVFSYGPGVPHVIRTNPDAPLLKYFVDFVGREGKALLASCGLNRGVPVQLANVAAVRSRFDELIWLGSVADARTPRTCALQFELLLHALARSIEPPTPGARQLRETFTRCREYMETNFLSVSSLAEVASACHVQGSHICRVFRQFHNESPLQYLHRLRMQWAADRLLRTAARVNEIADELGMDPFHFSRMFKRVHGVSPAILGGRSHRRSAAPAEPPGPAGQSGPVNSAS